MSIPAESILVRKVPFKDITVDIGVDEETGKMVKKKLPHPLNKVRVLAPSPISATAASVEEWNGIGGAALVIEPLSSFGPNEVAPVVALNREYDIQRLGPEDSAPVVIDRQQMVKKQQAMVSPEEAFAQAAFDQKELEGAVASDTPAAKENA